MAFEKILGFGILLIIISSIFLAFKENKNIKNIDIGFGGFIGPIPFGFFTSKKMFWFYLLFLVLIIIFWIILKKIL